MQNTNSNSPVDFEFDIFELLSANPDNNSAYINHQFAKLYVKYTPTAAKLTRKYHLNIDYVNDVLQEGIIILINRIKKGGFTFNAQYGFRSFLYRTFENLAANFNKKYRYSLEEEFGQQEQEDPYDYEFYTELPVDFIVEEKVQELITKNLSTQGAKVLEAYLIQNKTNEEGAGIMGYKDESIYRKKKSQHLKTLREKITYVQKAELLRMAS